MCSALARLLFVGKFDLADLPAMRLLRAEDLIQEPRFMPPWATDLRFLTSYLAYSVFLNEINLGSVMQRYADGHAGPWRFNARI